MPTAALAPIPFAMLPSLVAVAYLGLASAVWYGSSGTAFGTHATVYPLAIFGVFLWLATLLAVAKTPIRALSRQTIAVIASALGLFGLLWYFGRRPGYSLWFGDLQAESPLEALIPFFFYAASSVVLRMGAPLLIGRAVLGLRPRDLGYGFHGFDKSAWLYVLALTVAVPAVAYASSLPAFVQKYPLCKQAIDDGTLSVGVFVVYELAYALVFASGEAFWRGFITFGASPQLGANALFLMLIPYVLGHFGKPQGESLGAIAAGLFLGFLALRHRSFWLGAAVHWSVALMMDLWAISRRGVEWVI